MTGFNVERGDTNAVQMNLDNTEWAYLGYLAVIRRTAWFDEDDSTWNDIRKAACQLQTFVETVKADTAHDSNFGEIRDADLDRVDWVEIVEDVLETFNVDANRESRAGL